MFISNKGRELLALAIACQYDNLPVTPGNLQRLGHELLGFQLDHRIEGDLQKLLAQGHLEERPEPSGEGKSFRVTTEGLVQLQLGGHYRVWPRSLDTAVGYHHLHLVSNLAIDADIELALANTEHELLYLRGTIRFLRAQLEGDPAISEFVPWLGVSTARLSATTRQARLLMATSAATVLLKQRAMLRHAGQVPRLIAERDLDELEERLRVEAPDRVPPPVSLATGLAPPPPPLPPHVAVSGPGDPKVN